MRESNLEQRSLKKNYNVITEKNEHHQEFKKSQGDPSIPPTRFIEHNKILYTKWPGPAALKHDPHLVIFSYVSLWCVKKQHVYSNINRKVPNAHKMNG